MYCSLKNVNQEERHNTPVASRTLAADLSMYSNAFTIRLHLSHPELPMDYDDGKLVDALKHKSHFPCD